jgi:hypothetical protein
MTEKCEAHVNVVAPCCVVCLGAERDRYRNALDEIAQIAHELQQQSRFGVPPRASKCGDWAARLREIAEVRTF